MLTATRLAALYREAHQRLRDLDGLQPQDALEELLKVLFLRQREEQRPGEVPHRRGARRDQPVRQESAADLRRRFAAHLDGQEGAARELWADRRFRLSDEALLALYGIFRAVSLTAVDLDARSAALRLFLGPELRRGLGIYLTPDEVARTMVHAATPPPDAVVYDPACGSGTFLVETLRYWREAHPDERALQVFGADLNARMVLMAGLNLDHLPGVSFHRAVRDALAPAAAAGGMPAAAGADCILTNPPFGVQLPRRGLVPERFATVGQGSRRARVPGEILFFEQCLRLLRPGGLLGIVLPRSVLTNASLAGARAAVDELGALVGVIHLPSETFAATGTQLSTSVLFLERRRAAPAPGEVIVPVVEVTNVGHDATGRERPGNQLLRAGQDLAASRRTGLPVGLARPRRLAAARPLSALGETSGRRPASRSTRRLGDLLELAQTGRTPPRARYAASGIFILKVGNLTGQGIDWSPRQRNFVPAERASATLMLQPGEILLTASAHNPCYIARKVEIVQAIPSFVGGRATFVGEVMRLRARAPGIDPFELLALLRLPDMGQALRELVRGQTAHLHPREVLDLRLPRRSPPAELVTILRREAALALELSQMAARQRELLGALLPAATRR